MDDKYIIEKNKTIYLYDLLINTAKFNFIIITLLLLSLSSFTFAANRPGFVCGKFNGHVMEVSSKYIMYWAEYEGASAFDPDFIYNKKGCDANFVVLPMITTWPDMQPGDRAQRSEEGLDFSGLTLAVRPLLRISEPDITYYRDIILKGDKYIELSPINYHDDLDLFSVKITRTLFKPDPENNKKSPFLSNKQIIDYYWHEVEGRVPVIFRCPWHIINNTYSYCEAILIMPEIGTDIEIVFTPDKLPQWQKIISSTQAFLLSHIKHQGE